MAGSDRSRVVPWGEGFRWRGIDLRAYKDPQEGAFRGVTRQTLLAGDGAAALSFEARYFEVEPGGWTSLERHGHPHAVVVLRGRGTVRLPDGEHPIARFDCVYVAPEDAHQFRADDEGPLGFLCVVDAVRDRPRPVDDGEPPAGPEP